MGTGRCVVKIAVAPHLHDGACSFDVIPLSREWVKRAPPGLGPLSSEPVSARSLTLDDAVDTMLYVDFLKCDPKQITV